MKLKFLVRFTIVVLLIGVLYEIWPLPFQLMARYGVLPAAEKITLVARGLFSPIKLLARLNRLAADNKELQESNDLLVSEIAALQEKSHLCQEVESERQFSGNIPGTQLVAKVIGRTPQAFSQNLLVDKGSNDGLKEGAAVVSSGYLVGRVKKVFPAQAEVKLITGHDSLIPAVLEKSRETGLVQGGLEGLTLNEIPATSSVSQGDKVITSGLGGDLPAGILIGETDKILKGEQSLFQTMAVKTPIKFSTLEIVSILR